MTNIGYNNYGARNDMFINTLTSSTSGSGFFVTGRLSDVAQASVVNDPSLSSSLSVPAGAYGFIAKYSDSQNLVWVARIYPIALVGGCVATSDGGVIYSSRVTGGTTVTDASGASFSPSQLSGTPTGSIVLVKFNSSGAYVWSVAIWATNGTVASNSWSGNPCKNSSDGIFLPCFNNNTSANSGYVVHDSSNSTYAPTQLTSGTGGGYLFYFNSSGQYGWSAFLSSTTAAQPVYAHSSASDSSGNFFISGNYTGAGLSIIDGQGNTYTPYTGGGSTDYWTYYAKFNSSGGYVWTTRQALNLSMAGYSVVVSPAGDVYAGGGMNTSGGTFTIYDSTGSSYAPSHIYSSGWSPYIIKFSNNGIYQWAVCVDGTSSSNWGTPMAWDSNSSSVLVAVHIGATTQTVRNYAGSATTPAYTGGAATGAVYKFSSSGNFTAGYRPASAAETQLGIAVSSTGYITTAFQNSAGSTTATDTSGATRSVTTSGVAPYAILTHVNGSGQF